MFNFFRFNGGGMFTYSTFNMVNEFTQSFFRDYFQDNDFNQDEDIFYNSHNEDSSNNNYEADFINFESYEDMYILTINLKGINLRELSIQHNPGVIDINLYRLEMENNNLIKKHYNKRFDNIEDIEYENTLKVIDNGFLSIRMFKKYLLNDKSKIFDIEANEIIIVDKIKEKNK